MIDDVNFSDGCGFISPDLALKVAKKFGHMFISACQIRIAGCKGMLMLKPDLPGERIQIRQSMRKVIDHGNTKHALNVIRCSTFAPGHLHR